MAYKIYQKLVSAMANDGICNASDVDLSATVNGQSYTKVGAIINAIISFINGLSTTLSSLVSTGLKREIVQALPTGNNISETTIYLMLKDPAGASGDIYDEYMYINNNWEHIGSTEVDLSNYVQKPSNAVANKQYVMRNNQWEEVQIATDAANITYSGDVTGANNVEEAIDALVPDATLARQLKEAIGSEVGDVATGVITAGSIVFHNGRFYKINDNIYEGDRWGIEIEAVQTTLSDEINALRGVSSESVYLTITPTSAIPQAGVTAHIYNIKTQTNMAEVTILPSANRVHLGDVPFGDNYTIIMPSIDGYTQPADLTFKASQMIRERTVQYFQTSTNVESITLYATTSNSVAIPSGTYAIVTVYSQGGTVADTLSVDIGGGVSATFNIPFGSKYSIAWPTISGYYTPKTTTLVAGVSSRNIRARYLYVVVDDVMVVLKDLTEISFSEIDAVQQAFDTDNVLGIAFHPTYTSRVISGTTYTRPASVSAEDFHFMCVFEKCSLFTGKSWDSTGGSVLGNTDLTVRVTNPNVAAAWTGEANSDYMYQKIVEYETNSGVSLSNNIFKHLHGISIPTELQSSGKHFFLPAIEQWYFYCQKVSAVNTALAGFTTQYTLDNPSNNAKMASSEYDVTKCTIISNITSAYGSNNKNATSGMFHIALFPVVSTIIE